MPELCPSEKFSYDSIVIEGELQAMMRNVTSVSAFVSLRFVEVIFKSRVESRKEKLGHRSV